MLVLSHPSLVSAEEPPAKPAGQNPSPMVEHTRAHARLPQESPAGQRYPLRNGALFVPDRLPAGPVPLLVHFHGPSWIAEVAAARVPAAALAVPLGSGSAAYARPFADPAAFAALLQEAEQKAARRFDPVALSAWSAGYGAVRAILQVPEYEARIGIVILLDGLHCGYVGGKPGPKESSLVTQDLAPFVAFAREAAAGRKQFLLTHTEIFPGTFASTTETADHLLRSLDLRRQPVLRWGPLGTQILCEVRRGGFHLLGFAGNAAPDHIDLLHALPDLVREVAWQPRRE